jgi:hypothetical protein
VVLVDHAAEYPPALHRRVQRHDDHLVMIGWPMLQRRQDRAAGQSGLGRAT